MQLAGSRKMCWALNEGHDLLLTLRLPGGALPQKGHNEEGRGDPEPADRTIM